jgi:hypothetical protein
MRSARQGGESIGRVRRYRIGGVAIPAELAREALTYTDRSAPRGYPAATQPAARTRAETLANAESEGLRQRAMAEHSALRNAGAVRMNGRDPIWAGQH